VTAAAPAAGRKPRAASTGWPAGRRDKSRPAGRADAPAPLLGKATPRLGTAPLVTGRRGPCGCGCALTRRSSFGFEAIAFATDVLGVTLLSWQRYWLIHALEKNPLGTGFRYRTVLTLVGRQQGKTTLLKLVSLYMLYMGRAQLVLGAAQSLDIARESWQGAVELAEDIPDLADEVAAVRRANGEQCLTLTNGARYRITAATRGAGRGLSVDLLILDELREHRDWLAWAALSKTTMARPGALIVCISNAGDDESVVLNALRASALAGDDEQLGIFEWSAPDGCDLDDVEAWAQSCPGLGVTISESAIRSAMHTDPPAVFRTELLCQHVEALDGAVDLAAWKAGGDPAGSLAGLRERVVVCLDVAPDGQHVTLAGAALLPDGRARVEVLAAWSSTEPARVDLPELLDRIRPAAVAWFPSGPAAALAADIRPRAAADPAAARRRQPRPAPWRVVELKGSEVNEACMAFADLVLARRVLHPSDPLLNAHVVGSQKLRTGEGWRFARRGAGHCDAAYAAAGAVHTARTEPEPERVPRSRIF
jgi:hypothetical protein